MKLILIFALLINNDYANTNLKIFQCSRNALLRIVVDKPSTLDFYFMKPHENLSLEDMPGEIWKDIPGYEGLSHVSNMGRIKSIAPLKIRKQELKNGYLSITISKDGKRYKHYVHRVVALSFLGPSTLQVDHINGCKKDNKYKNLRYATPKQNIRYFLFNKKQGVPVGITKTKDGKYRTTICIGTKKINLGRFDSLEKAHIAYITAENDIDNIANYQKIKKSSEYGVGIRKTNSLRYRASIWYNGKSHAVGTFDTVAEAIIKRENYKNEIHSIL